MYSYHGRERVSERENGTYQPDKCIFIFAPQPEFHLHQQSGKCLFVALHTLFI
jgi:hypothetical protein